MFKKYFYGFFIFAAILLSAPGCASMFNKVFIKPKLTYEAMKIDRLEITGATVRLYLGIDNKNNMSFEIINMEHVVSLEKNKVLETVMTDRVHIKAREKTIVEFPVDISFLGLKDNVKNIWKNQKIEYQVQSTLLLNTALGKIPLKIKFEDVINLPPFPDLKIEDVKVEKMGFTETNMIFKIRVINNDKIKLNVNELSYEILLNDFEIAKGNLDTPKNEKDNEKDKKDNKDIVLEIPVNMKLLSLKRSITDMLKKGEINYDVHIHMNVNSTYGEYILPLDKKGTKKLY